MLQRSSFVLRQSPRTLLSRSLLIPRPFFARFGGGALGPTDAEKNTVIPAVFRPIDTCVRLLHKTRRGHYFVVGASSSILYKPEIHNVVRYYSGSGEKKRGAVPRYLSPVML